MRTTRTLASTVSQRHSERIELMTCLILLWYRTRSTQSYDETGRELRTTAEKEEAPRWSVSQHGFPSRERRRTTAVGVLHCYCGNLPVTGTRKTLKPRTSTACCKRGNFVLRSCTLHGWDESASHVVWSLISGDATMTPGQPVTPARLVHVHILRPDTD